MNLHLVVCLAFCLFMVLPSKASYRRSAVNINRIFADLLRDEENQPCMSWTDQQPAICKDMLRIDPGYCEDYGELPFCRRTCSSCGPKESKPPAPAGDCEDKRGDCEYLMHMYHINHCETQQTYAFKYCRKYCNICQKALGSVWKP